MTNLFDNYMQKYGTVNLFGEAIAPNVLRKAAAMQMYRDAISGGAKHQAAYAMLVDEAGVEDADYAAAWGYHLSWIVTSARQDPRLYGETWTEFAKREANV